MSLDRTQVETMLDGLEASLPGLLERYDTPEMFWPIFSGEADVLKESCNPEDSAYVRGRIDCMLRNAGMIPGEDEGSTCR
jgi:hypothetical protein